MQSYSVQFANYTTHILQVNTQLQFLERTGVIDREGASYDVFPSSWFLFISEPDAQKIYIQFPDGEKTFDHPTAVFLPNKHLIHWRLLPGKVRWTAFRGESPLPSHLSERGLVLPWKQESFFRSTDEILKCIERQKEILAVLPTAFNNSKRAQQLKHHIDENYLSGRRVRDFCHDLDMNESSLTHLFKKCYRLTPNDYLNRLKLNAAIKELSINDMPLIEACYESGFEEYSNFFRQFKQWLGVNPKHIVAAKNQTDFENDRDEELLST